MYTKGNLPLELWLGRGLPLNPYVRGVLFTLLTKEMRPKQLSLPPEEVQLGPGAVDFLEYSMLRRWVSSWLRYYSWYASQSVNLGASLQSWFEGPQITNSWQVKDENPELVKFGIFFQLFDLVGRFMRSEIKPPEALSEMTSFGSCYVVGGKGDSKFLVFAQGLNQPCARRGVVIIGETLYDTFPMTIQHKTLGVTERQRLVGYSRYDSSKRIWDYI